MRYRMTMIVVSDVKIYAVLCAHSMTLTCGLMDCRIPAIAPRNIFYIKLITTELTWYHTTVRYSIQQVRQHCEWRNFHRKFTLMQFISSSSYSSSYSSSSSYYYYSICTTSRSGLWPVEQCPPIFSYLLPTLSIFSLPALEDLFLFSLSSFPESSPSSRPFQFLSEDLFGHPIFLLLSQHNGLNSTKILL